MLNIEGKKIFILAVSLFLLLNLGAIFLSWQGRSLPPEPDDTNAMLFYLRANIDYDNVFSKKLKIFNRPYYWTNDNGLDRLNFFSWAYFWGKTAKLLSLQPIVALKLSFYSGIVLFLVSTLYFFQEKKWLFKIILVVTLAFFTGDGTYHGLYWPASSLYSVSLFLLILKIIIDNKKNWIIKLFFILPVFILIHPLSIISLFSLPVFILLNNLCLKNKDIKLHKRLFIVFTVSVCFYFILFKLLSLWGINLVKNTDLIYAVFSNLLTGKLSFSQHSMAIILDKYFLYLLTRPFFLTLFLLGLIKAFLDDKRLLILYSSFMPLLLMGLFFNGGERILLHVWILTFFILVFGLIYLIELTQKSFTKKINRKLFLLILFNIILEIIFALFFIKLDCMKNIILRYFFIWSNIMILIFVISGWLFKKRLGLILILFSTLNFFIFLSLEKAAMVIFQRQNNNIVFNKNLFLNKIQKDGIIIYNDNLSFALFSGSGLLEREAVKKGSLKIDDLAKAGYFVAMSSQFSDCKQEECILEEQGQKRQMKRIASDDNFLLYEF